MFNKVSEEYLKTLKDAAVSDNKEIVVSALILRDRRIFVQKRSAERKLFPNGWDVIGGHLEKGESIAQALKREIFEESSWILQKIIGHILTFDWQAGGKEKREFAFLVKVRGNLDAPKLEKDKHSNYRWLSQDEIEILADDKDDMYIYDLLKKAFQLI